MIIMNQSKIFSKMIRKKVAMEKEAEEEYNVVGKEEKREEESTCTFADVAETNTYETPDAGPQGRS